MGGMLIAGKQVELLVLLTQRELAQPDILLPACLLQGIRGPHTPIVKFVCGTHQQQSRRSARRNWGLCPLLQYAVLAGNTFETVQSIHHNDFNVHTPALG